MADAIQFRTGDFQTFVATRSFSLGSTGLNIVRGQEILFDGNQAEVGGQRYPTPQLRGALRQGWIVVPEEFDDSEVNPLAPKQSANVLVRPAVNTGANPLSPPRRAPIAAAEPDERIVSTRADRMAAAEQRTRDVRSGAARPTRQVLEGGAEYGVEVNRTFRTAAKAVTEVTPNSVGAAIMDADRVKVAPGSGLSQEEYLARLSDEEREAYLAKKAMYVGEKGQTVQAAPVVGRVKTARKTSEAGGISATVTVGGGTDVADPSYGGQGKESVVVVDGVTLRNTNGPKRDNVQAQPAPEPTSRIGKDGTADARRKIAKALCSDFPADYDFDDHWKRRLAMIRLHFENRPEVIKAIFAAESDEFKKALLEEFPEAFA